MRQTERGWEEQMKEWREKKNKMEWERDKKKS